MKKFGDYFQYGIWLVAFLAVYILLVIAAFVCAMIKVWRM